MKTFIMLVAGVGNLMPESVVVHLKNYIGIMNIDADYYSNELPGVVYNGALTKAQKLELKEYLVSKTDFNIVPLFIEFNDNGNEEDFVGTLSVKYDTDNILR